MITQTSHSHRLHYSVFYNREISIGTPCWLISVLAFFVLLNLVQTRKRSYSCNDSRCVACTSEVRNQEEHESKMNRGGRRIEWEEGSDERGEEKAVESWEGREGRGRVWNGMV